MRHLMTQTCTVLLAVPTTSGFGTKTAARTWPSTGAQYPCRLQLSGGGENSGDLRDVSIRDGKLFLPPEAVIATTARVAVDGATFEVLSVYPVHSPAGLHHYEVQVRTFSGGVPSA